MVLDGSLGYIGRAEEPTRILFKGGRITEIEETPTGIRLKKYMEDYQDPRIYILRGNSESGLILAHNALETAILKMNLLMGHSM